MAGAQTVSRRRVARSTRAARRRSAPTSPRACMSRPRRSSRFDRCAESAQPTLAHATHARGSSCRAQRDPPPAHCRRGRRPSPSLEGTSRTLRQFLCASCIYFGAQRGSKFAPAKSLASKAGLDAQVTAICTSACSGCAVSFPKNGAGRCRSGRRQERAVLPLRGARGRAHAPRLIGYRLSPRRDWLRTTRQAAAPKSTHQSLIHLLPARAALSRVARRQRHHERSLARAYAPPVCEDSPHRRDGE